MNSKLWTALRWWGFVLLVVTGLISCGGGGGETNAGNNLSPPIGDLSGDWQVSGADSSPTPSCSGVGFNLTATISQSGNSLTETGFRPSTLSGTISGNEISMSGSYPEDGGTTTINSSISTVTADCNQFTGNDSWSWTDGTSSCSGTSTYTATRLTGNGCGGGSGGNAGGGRTSPVLDTSFGTTGKVTADLGGDDTGGAVAVDSADRIIIAGVHLLGGSSDFALVRYDTDGTLDTTFGVNGKSITDLGANDRGRSMVIDVNGKIVFGGDSIISDSDFALARYNGDGTLDTSFDGNGYVITDFGSRRPEPAMDITIDANGKIIAAGFAHNGTNYDFAVVRYNTNGSLDTSFGASASGIVATDLGGDDRISGVAVDANGKILVVGRTGSASDYDFAMLRYNSNGTIDTAFGTSGVVIVSFGGTDDRAREVAFDSNGKIVIVGRSNASGSNDFVIMRYNDDGSLDASFGINGKVITDIGGSNDQGRSVVIDSSGRIIALGRSDNEGDNDFAVIRYLSNGSLDTTFDTDGMAFIDFGGDDRGVDVVLDSNGMIVVGGKSDAGSGNDFAAARLTP